MSTSRLDTLRMKWLVLLASVLLYCVAADPSLEAKKTKRQAPHEEESTPAPENTRYGIHECVHDKVSISSRRIISTLEYLGSPYY